MLLGKAVIVAILGSDGLLPDPRHPGRVGLLYLYSSVVLGLLASFAESAAATGLVAGWQKRFEAAAAAEDGEAGAPLLGRKPPAAAAAEQAPSATIGVLLGLSAPDGPLLLLAFAAGAVAALAQALIPFYTGRIIDYASIDPDPAAFRRTTLRLLGVAAACAAATGVRGGLFTVAMTRLNVRLRRRLFSSLLRQDAGFFDVTKTGEITSRLAADTTTVSDQICLNLNVALRSATQAVMVLGFMFTASWRLTVVTFVIIPCVIALSKVYGNYYRRMSKKVQSELAAANSVAEEALSTMSTVKAHAAQGSCEAAYAERLACFYALQLKEAAAYAVSRVQRKCEERTEGGGGGCMAGRAQHQRRAHFAVATHTWRVASSTASPALSGPRRSPHLLTG